MGQQEIGFWLLAIIGAGLIVWSAIEASKKESSNWAKRSALIIPITGAVMTLISTYHTHQSDNRNQDTSNVRDKDYKLSFRKTLDSAHSIINALNKSIVTANKTLDTTTSVLKYQKEQERLLSQQLLDTRKVLSNTQVNLSKSDRALYEFNRINNSLQKIRLIIGMDYPINDKSYAGDEGSLLTHNIVLANLNYLLYDTNFQKIDWYRVVDGTKTKKQAYINKNAIVVKEYNSRQDSLLYSFEIWDQYKGSQTEYNHYFPVIWVVHMSLFKKVQLDENGRVLGKGSQLSAAYQASDDKIGQIKRDWQRIDLKKNIAYERLSIELEKKAGDNSAISSLDLKKFFMQLDIASRAKFECNSINIDFGENYSSHIYVKRDQIVQTKYGLINVKL